MLASKGSSRRYPTARLSADIPASTLPQIPYKSSACYAIAAAPAKWASLLPAACISQMAST